MIKEHSSNAKHQSRSADSLHNDLIIIPAAGYGTRVGGPEAKEMLSDPETGKVLIDRALQLAKGLNIPALVITREEKKNLIQELNNRQQDGEQIKIVLSPPTKEWPETILKSKEYWAERNLIVLPDTKWSPIEAAKDALQKLKTHSVVYAVFKVKNDLSFGFVAKTKDGLRVCEKPKFQLEEGYNPWGLMGFQKTYGVSLLQAHLDSTFDHEIKTIDAEAEFVQLDDFVDLTRANYKENKNS